MKYKRIDCSLFIKNRGLLNNLLNDRSLAIFNSNDIMPTNSDGTMPFIQNSDLFWLSGIDQEESVLILFPGNEDQSMREILFLKETNEHIAIWEGEKLTKVEATNNSGIKKIYWLDDLNKILDDLITKVDFVYLNQNIHSRATSNVQTRDDRFRILINDRYHNKQIEEIAPLMHKLRARKSKLEIDLIQTACNITEGGFRRILPIIKPGIMEYEIEAELIH